MLIGGEYSYHLSSYLITQYTLRVCVEGQSYHPAATAPGGKDTAGIIHKRLGVRGASDREQGTMK